MNILQLGASLPNWGGIEHHILSLSTSLINRGHRVTLACQPGSFLYDESAVLGIPRVGVYVKHVLDWDDFDVLLNMMRAEEFDAVHVHAPVDHVIAPMAARLRDVPCVVATHHLPLLQPKLPLGPMISYHYLFDRVLAVSNFIADLLVEHEVPADLVELVHHGTDFEQFERTTLTADQVREAWGIPTGAVLIGTAGRLSREKGVDMFLQAAAEMPDECWFVVIGDGADAVKLKKLAESLGILGRTVFAGYRADVNNAINALDIFVLPSLWHEPCAAVVQQAMILRKPVIGTNTGGTPDMIVDGETGYLIARRDVAALTAAMTRLMRSPESRSGLGECGRKRAKARFSLGDMVTRIEAIYRGDIDIDSVQSVSP